MKKILVIGGGAAGMFAAIAAGRKGYSVSLFEKNEKLGKKLFITGKGRCNLTNACDMEVLFESVVTNSRFLYSSFYGFTNQDAIAFFEELGLPTKVERGERVFPRSDHSSDVIRVLEQELKRLGVRVFLNREVREIREKDGRFQEIVLADGKKVEGDACIVATGGISYRTTGSTGDGYRFARELGHTVKECRPSLVPMETGEGWTRELQGLSLRNVSAAIYDGKKKLYEEFGEMLFTHYGVSGPLMLTASSYVGDKLISHPLKLVIDLKPALSQEQLDHRILRDFEENKNRQFKNSLGKLFPAKLIPVMVRLSGIRPDTPVNSVTRQEREHLSKLLKGLPLTITGTRGFQEAIITKGGVDIKGIRPKDMGSKYVEGLYFAGEVLDVDALTGGFNLQIAWATGRAAGKGAAG